ncbi:MAG TPA: ASKHA domain-containing protein [Bacillota bacterium]
MIDKSRKYKVRFTPDNLVIEVPVGTNLHQAAAIAGLELRSGCGGEGSCGRCAVLIKEGKPQIGQGSLGAKYRREGYVLACRTLVTDDLVVEVPATSRLSEHQMVIDKLGKREILAENETDPLTRFPLEPFSRKFFVQLEPPTLTENASDLSRLLVRARQELGREDVRIDLETLRCLPDLLREAEWGVTVTTVDFDGQSEIVRVEPGRSPKPAYGLAVDIGTTSNVVQLIDLSTGLCVGQRGTYNRQARYGDDVITRIIHAVDSQDGRRQLQTAVTETLNDLIGSLLAAGDLGPEDVTYLMAAGNTTMAHLFLGLSPKYIRLEPYIPAATTFPILRAKDLGLKINPAAPVLSFPAVASYVGGDIVSGLLATDMFEAEGVSLFMDFGTNGEMVLGNRDWLVTCSCSMGPCFEGGGVTFGMRATPGAIQRIKINPRNYEVKLSTVGGDNPRGICGSGLVDALAKLREAGIIDRAGKFQDVTTDRRRNGPDGPEFVLAWGRETQGGRDIVITESDVKNLIRAKGAAYAAFRSMLRSMSLDFEAIGRIYIAGAFGNYLNVRDSVEIGMIPDAPPGKYLFIGNSSVKGARVALMSKTAYRLAEDLAKKMTYLELSVDPGYMDEFMSALFLPHTDLSQFASVRD